MEKQQLNYCCDIFHMYIKLYHRLKKKFKVRLTTALLEPDWTAKRVKSTAEPPIKIAPGSHGWQAVRGAKNLREGKPSIPQQCISDYNSIGTIQTEVITDACLSKKKRGRP